MILQAAGTHSPAACRRALAPGGTLVQISGDSSNRWIGPIGRAVAAAALSPLVSQRMTTFTVQPNQRDLALLADLVERGQVTPVLDRTFALGEASDAVRHVEGGHTRGKAVINLNRS